MKLIYALLVVLLGTSSAISQELEAGSLLVATDELLDPHFAETVILLLHYGSDGALGFTPLRARSATPSYAGSGGAPRTVPQSLVFSHSRASSECMGATLAGLVVMFVWA